MYEDSFEAIADELDTLLEAERSALLSGDLDRIGRLLSRKESLVDGFSALRDIDKKRLNVLAAKLKRNQELLDQALGGIRSVANRLSALKRVRKSLDTYDARGAKQSVDLGRKVSFEKRA